MDRSWINVSRISEEYENGVEAFLEFAQQNGSDSRGRMYCPCNNCLNERRLQIDQIREHLLCDGFCKSYTTWTWHGELYNAPTQSETIGVSLDMEDHLEDMIRDVGYEPFNRQSMYDNLCTDGETPLYPGCTKFTRLSAVLRLFTLKARNGWTDKSFTELLELLEDMLPEGNTLPKRNYDAKKVLCPMGMEYKKIHACPNDCILYRNDFEGLHQCPVCQLSRYKVKDDDSSFHESATSPPAKVLWYLPIIPRFKRLFANANDANNLRWHANERHVDGKLRHPADSLQWKKIDELFPEFGNEARNLRLGLATDGMNPYGNMSSTHSSWPVLLVIYNLPSELCMKRKYVMLSMMISGPHQPGNDIDVYLAPLIEDLRILWDVGVNVFDGYANEYFNMRAMLFCTINDFPAYGNLCGYTVKGHKACPICEEDTSYHQLLHGRKTVYLRHRRFLKHNHPYRRLRKAFNGHPENETSPIALTGEEAYERVKDIQVIFGKTQKKSADRHPWKKKSIFFDLPYWCKLDVRHCLDVMHVEKNVCDSVIGTLLNIPGKTKDGVNSRLDLLQMGIREELAPQSVGRRTYLPPACHTLSKQEKRSFCECLHNIKVPQGYSSNFRRLVSMKDLKLVGLKSHDCHVLMQQLLPVAIRGILPKNVRHTISRLCFFFNAICSKVIDPHMLDELENEAAIILCQLEMYFPPSFFDIMVHLIVHLVREIRLCGPVYLRWMYPIERYMKILKGYVKNPRRPEASIVERYVAEESIEFCTQYLSEVDAIGIPKTRHEGRSKGKGTKGITIISMAREEVLQAHLYILNNTDEAQPYLSAHKTMLRETNVRMNEKWLFNEHSRTFLPWFASMVDNDPNASETLKWLAHGPNFDVICWSGYDVNSCSFYTESQDDKSTMQNSGVMVVAESMHFSSSKDQNPVMASIPYFGVIEDIWEIDYTKFRVPIFKCKWVNSNHGVKVDELGFTLVDLNRLSHKNDPFIMAYQPQQVFYVKDPSNHRWSIVLQRKSTIGCDDNIDTPSVDISQNQISSRISIVNDEIEIDDVHVVREDHQEGIWENVT